MIDLMCQGDALGPPHGGHGRGGCHRTARLKHIAAPQGLQTRMQAPSKEEACGYLTSSKLKNMSKLHPSLPASAPRYFALGYG